MATTRVDSDELRRLRQAKIDYRLLQARVDKMPYVIIGVHDFFANLLSWPNSQDNSGLPGTPIAGKGWEFEFGVIRVIVYPFRDRVRIVDAEGIVDPFEFLIHEDSISERDQMMILGYVARVKRARSDGADHVAGSVVLVPESTTSSS